MSARVLALAAMLGLLVFGGQSLATGAGGGRTAAVRLLRSATPPGAGGWDKPPRAHTRARRGLFSLHHCHRRRHRCRRRGDASSKGRVPPSVARSPSPTPSTQSAPAGVSSPSGGAGSGQVASGGTAPSTETQSSTPSGPARVQVLAKEYSLTLSRSEVPAGKVTVELVNGGEDPHNLHLEEPTARTEAGAFPTSAPKTHPDLTFELKPGSYTLFCALPEHEAKGMKATLTVR